jgi:HEAT repeat protein
VLVAEHDSPYRVKDQEDVKEVVAMLSHEDEEVRLDASTSLYRALVKGLDLQKHVKEIAAAMFDESDIVRISNCYLLFSMACCEVDIREAEALLRKVMEGEHKLPRYYAALALGKMYWYEGNREGLESIMHELSKNDRKIIMETIDQMPAPANDPYRS